MSRRSKMTLTVREVAEGWDVRNRAGAQGELDLAAMLVAAALNIAATAGKQLGAAHPGMYESLTKALKDGWERGMGKSQDEEDSHE